MPSGPKKRKAAKRKKAKGAHHHHRPDSSPTNLPLTSSSNQGNGVRGDQEEKNRSLAEEERKEKMEDGLRSNKDVTGDIEEMGSSENGGEGSKEEGKSGNVNVEFVQSEKGGGDGGDFLEGELKVDEGSEVIESEEVTTDRVMESFENGSEEIREEGVSVAVEKIDSQPIDVLLGSVQHKMGDDGGEREPSVGDGLKDMELEQSSKDICPASPTSIADDGAMEKLENGRAEYKEEGKAVAMTVVEVLPKVGEVNVELVHSDKEGNDGDSMGGDPRIIEGLKGLDLEKSAEENCLGSAGVATYMAIENGREEPKVVVAEEVLSKAGDVSVEFVHYERGDDGGSNLDGEPVISEGSKEFRGEKLPEGHLIPIKQFVHVSEEVTQDSRMPAETSVATVGAIDSSSHEREVKAMPRSDETGGPSSDLAGAEIASETEIASAPPMVHRASLWNCCGLLDVLAGSHR